MPPSKFKPKKKRSRANEALARLRKRWEEENPDEEWEADREPGVTSLLRSVDGGIPSVIEAIRSHDDDDAKAFVETWEAASRTDRKHLPIEAVAFASGIGSLRLAEIAQTALYLYASAQTKLLISSSMVKVTKSIVKAATDQVPITALDWETGQNKVVGHTNGDVKAMEMFGRMSGILPVPKGAQIAIQNVYGKEDAPEKPALPGWRQPEDRLKEIYDMTEPRRLPSPATEPISIGGHIDRLQDQTVHILRDDV